MSQTTNELRALDYPDMANTLRRLSCKRLLQKTEAQQLLDAANMLVKLGQAADALARHEQAQGGMAWRPIETAPKDGETEILVWSACGEADVAIRPIGCPDDAVCDRNWIAFDATHWMPLPEPPTRPTADARQETQG